MKKMFADMKVEQIKDVTGDLFVVNVARVSMGKWHPEFLEMQDTNLINYLAKHKHWSPFAHPHLTFRIKAPIFVARQLAKTQVGMVWNEISRRYVDETPQFYLPEFRKRAPNVKQGSLNEVVSEIQFDCPFDEETKYTQSPISVFEAQCVHAVDVYNSMLEAGIAPEIARTVLPQSMLTEWIWTGSLYGFVRVCQLRLESHAQKESREIAKELLKFLLQDYPVSTRALLPEFTEEK